MWDENLKLLSQMSLFVLKRGFLELQEAENCCRATYREIYDFGYAS